VWPSHLRPAPQAHPARHLTSKGPIRSQIDIMDVWVRRGCTLIVAAVAASSLIYMRCPRRPLHTVTVSGPKPLYSSARRGVLRLDHRRASAANSKWRSWARSRASFFAICPDRFRAREDWVYEDQNGLEEIAAGLPAGSRSSGSRPRPSMPAFRQPVGPDRRAPAEQAGGETARRLRCEPAVVEFHNMLASATRAKRSA
jgi:hypothetical protein